MAILTIDQEIEATKAIIRAGGKATEARPLLDDVFGAQTDAERTEDAIDKLMRLARAQERMAAAAGASDSYDRL